MERGAWLASSESEPSFPLMRLPLAPPLVLKDVWRGQIYLLILLVWHWFMFVYFGHGRCVRSTFTGKSAFVTLWITPYLPSSIVWRYSAYILLMLVNVFSDWLCIALPSVLRNLVSLLPAGCGTGSLLGWDPPRPIVFCVRNTLSSVEQSLLTLPSSR